MKRIGIIFSLLQLVIFFSCCTNTNQKPGICGLWVSNEKTSQVFLSGTRKAVLQIKENQEGELTARGMFLWDDNYLMEWELEDFQIDESNEVITIVDTDLDTFKAIFNKKDRTVKGAFFLKDSDGLADSLILNPADKGLEIELLYPRLPDTNGKIDYSYQKPEQLYDGLLAASVEDVGIRPDSIISLIKKVINQEYGRLESLLILKDNKLVVEEYFYGYGKTCLHKINSCTKSITSLLLGIALKKHKDANVGQSVFRFFPGYSSLKSNEKGQITLKNVLSMTSGLQWDEYPKEMYETNDWFQYILSRPLETEPGVNFHYNSGGTILLGGVIHFLEGKQADQFAEEALFSPLKISEYSWETHQDGRAQCGAGLQMLPRDMAKIGLLTLNNGKWQDKQIVPEDWLNESATAYIQESEFFDYGYQWWLRTKNTRQWWKDDGSNDKYNMIVALGWGGQHIIVVKELNLVVITTASNFHNDKALSAFPMVTEEIIPAIANLN